MNADVLPCDAVAGRAGVTYPNLDLVLELGIWTWSLERGAWNLVLVLIFVVIFVVILCFTTLDSTGDIYPNWVVYAITLDSTGDIYLQLLLVILMRV